jgi:hypothetical protein
LTIKKNPKRCSGAAGYIASEDISSFFNNQNSRPSNFLFQIARDLGATLSECPFSSKKRTSLKRLLQDKTTSRLHVERTRNKLDSSSKAGETKRSSSSTMKCPGLVDAGPVGFPSGMTMSRAPWPEPRIGARRGAASATSNPSRIGQISRISMKSNFCS